jgi:hypothetical protein
MITAHPPAIELCRPIVPLERLPQDDAHDGDGFVADDREAQ